MSHAPDPQRPNLPPMPSELSDTSLDALFAEISAETVDRPLGLLGRVRELPTNTRAAIALAAQLAIAAAAVGLQGLRDDASAIGVALGVVGAVAALVGLGSLASIGRNDRLMARWLPLSLLLPAVVALVPLWPGMKMGLWEAMPIHEHCLAASTVVGLLCIVPLLLLDRHGLLRRWSVLAAASSAGAYAFVVQMLVCPLSTVEHRVFGHGSAGLVLALVVGGLLALRARLRK